MFFGQLLQRLGSESPRFFKIMQIASLVLGAIAAAMKWLIDNDVWDLNEPTETKVSKVLTAVIAFFGGSLFASATGTTKPELMDDKTKTNVLQDTKLR